VTRGAAAFDLEGRVHAWNGALELLTGRTGAQVAGTTFGTLLPFLPSGEDVRLLQGTLQGQVTSAHGQRPLQGQNGMELSLDIMAAPMRDAAGAVVGGMLVIRGIAA
jgi:PAS domain S-box-containing protein